MDIQEIQKRIDAIRAGMTAKGLAKAEAIFWMKSDEAPHVFLQWFDAAKSRSDYDRQCQSFRGDTLAEIFQQADGFVAALPSADEAKLHEFMGALGKVIDLGRSRGVDVEFVNPLIATMKRLSENVITDQRAA